ncbi:NUC130/3NT domain-containing protein, partial [Cladochytrium replicatum]
SDESVEFEELVNFIAQVSTCYPKESEGFPQQLIDLLSAHHNVMAPGTRMAVVQALMLLRNRDVIPTIDVLPLFFTLFRCSDQTLGATLRKYIVTDIKHANAKHRNSKINKTLQNYMYTVFKESD